MSTPPGATASPLIAHPPDPIAHVPPRLPARAWAAGIFGFFASYLFLFLVVHPFIDLRRCIAQLPDPLFGIIPHDRRWYFVSHELYYVANASGVISFVVMARRGDHRPFLRFGIGLTLQALLRSVTMALLPLCKWNITPGTAALTPAELPRLHLGPIDLAYRTWATNDLVFSGHVAEFLLMLWAGRNWPRPARAALIAFQLLQAYALVATRGHYTIDLVVAVPFAFVADRLAIHLLATIARPRAGAAPNS